MPLFISVLSQTLAFLTTVIPGDKIFCLPLLLLRSSERAVTECWLSAVKTWQDDNLAR